MKIVAVCLCLLPTVIQSCILLLNGWVPVSLDKRTRSADIVVSGYVKTAFKQKRTRAQTYKVEFKVNTVLKGKKRLDQIRSVDRVYNVSNFGDTKLCYADLDQGMSYILFLTTFKRRLSAKYDDIFGAAERYSLAKEEEILTSLGWLPWSDWSPCSRTCSSGEQTRVRTCNSTCSTRGEDDAGDDCDGDCPGETEERRNCNMFVCRDSKNLLDFLPAWRLPSGATRHKNSTVELERSVGVHFRSSHLYPVALPLQFSIVLTVRPSSETGGYILSLSDFSGNIKMALKSDESSIHFTYEDQTFEQRTVKFAVTLNVDEWHRLAFGVERGSVSFYYDCLFDSTVQLPRAARILSSDTVTSVGLPFGKKNEGLPSFRGLISELFMIDDASAAGKQCAVDKMPMNAQGDSIRPNVAVLATKSPDGDANRPIGGRNNGDGRVRLRVDDEHPSWEEEGGSYGDEDDVTASRRKHETGAAAENVFNEVEVPPPEPQWSTWSLCSKSCGNGVQTRSRDCRNHGYQVKCGLREGAAHLETRYCHLEKCPAQCSPPCLNGGQCVAMDTCECVSGYDGHRCQTAVCESGCANGGSCIAPNTCSCRHGYSGPTCNQAVCDRPCEHGGLCREDRKCWCRSGSHGRYCQYFHCDLPCENEGRCVAPNTCHCPFGTSGPRCQTAARCRHCLNGGQCLPDNRCKCRNGYYGNRCERRQCSYQPVYQTYVKGHRRLERYEVAVRCNQWSWRICTEERVRYRMVYRVAYRTEYRRVCT